MKYLIYDKWINQLSKDIFTHTQEQTFTLPNDFVYSTNKKWIVVQYCGVVVENAVVGDIMIHSDIVELDPYCDHFIMLANRRQTKYRKYQFNNYKREYKLWFTINYGLQI